MTVAWDQRDDRERRRVRDHLLEDWLPAATEFSPYWRERVRALDRSPAGMTTADDLAALTPSRERDLLTAGGPGAPQLVMRPTEEQVKARASGNVLLELARSIGRGGAAGKQEGLRSEYKPVHLHRAGVDGRLAIAFTRSDLDRLHLAGARAARVAGLDPSDYVVNAVPAGPTLAFWGVYHLALGSSMLAVHPRTGAALTEVPPAFELLPATAVAVPTGDATRLAAAVLEAGVDVGGVRTILTVGPPPPPARRGRIRRVWESVAGTEVAVRALWAPSGSRALWAECDGGEHGLHTLPDLEHLEVIDPVTLDESDEGDLVYTSMGWHGSALLRYQTGMHVEGLTHEPCSGCGRTVPRITGAVTPDAWHAPIRAGEGTAWLDLRGAAAVLQAPGVEAWRVEVDRVGGDDTVLVEVAGAVGDLDALTERLAAAMGVWPTDVRRRPDAAPILAAVERTGSVYADLRAGSGRGS